MASITQSEFNQYVLETCPRRDVCVCVVRTHVCDGTKIADFHKQEFPPLLLAGHTVRALQHPCTVFVVLTHLQEEAC